MGTCNPDTVCFAIEHTLLSYKGIEIEILLVFKWQLADQNHAVMTAIHQSADTLWLETCICNQLQVAQRSIIC